VISTADIAWAAGLIEGEGSFAMAGRTPKIAVNMIDRDIIERLAVILGGRVYGPYDRSHVNLAHHPIWRTQVNGPSSAGWMMTLFALLGIRRREQVRRTLGDWRSMRYVKISPGVERALLESWDSGDRIKLHLARRFGIGRETVYNVLLRNERISRVKEVLRHIGLDLAWLAGLFEGEGNVSINGKSLTVRIKMTDEDVVMRAAAVMGAKVYSAPTQKRKARKPTWIAQAKGSIAAGVIMTLYPWLGVRRREQARSALAAWKRQGHGVVVGPIADAMVVYRKAGYSQADIMELFKVGKSTVYRHTKNHVRRMHVTRRRPILPPTTSRPI
jgi:hypothetical protein